MTNYFKRIIGVLVGGTALLMINPVMGAQSAPAATGEVYVLQGLNGKALDLSLGGEVVAEGSAAKEVTGPLELPAGKHEFEATEGGKSVVKATVTVSAGKSTDVIVHLPVDASREPIVSTFDNDLSAIGEGQTRLAVAHTAAVGPADIVVDGRVLFSNVAGGETLTQVVPASTYDVKIVPTAKKGPAVLGPVELPIAAGTLTRVFAIGDAKTGNMDAIVQELPLGNRGGSAPTTVDGGDGGQAAALMGTDPTSESASAVTEVGARGGDRALVVAAGVGMVLLTVGALGLARRRRDQPL